MTYNIADINSIIKDRRTVKPDFYSDKEIDKVIIEQLLENAHWAPSHNGTEPWRFVVITGDARKSLSNFKGEWYKNNTPEALFNEGKLNKVQSYPLRSACIIAIGMVKDPNGKIPEVEDIEAVACAVQNMQLTATAYGIGAYWNTNAVCYTPQVVEYLGWASGMRCLGFLYLGYPKAELSAEGHRKTRIEDKTEWRSDNI
jgi:nitroreductase